MTSPMLPTYFLVCAVVAPQLRDKFDHWTSTDYLPRTRRFLGAVI
jgi:hypothetical protein